MNEREPSRAGWLCAAAVAVFLVAGLSQPRGVTVIDEVDYLTEAQALAAFADLRDRRAYLPRNGGVPWVGPRYPLGWPLLLAPFVRAGAHSISPGINSTTPGADSNAPGANSNAPGATSAAAPWSLGCAR